MDRIRGEKVIYEDTRRSKIQRVRKRLWTYVVFMCSANVLAPVKQETLERTTSLKKKNICVYINIYIKKKH